MLVHGGRNHRAFDNGERMRDALRRHDKVVDWVVYPEEGHGFQFLENELAAGAVSRASWPGT